MESTQFRDQADASLDESVAQVLSLIASNDIFQEFDANDGVRNSLCVPEETGISIFRAIGQINHSAEAVCAFVLDYTRKKTWDEMLLDSYPVKEFNARFKIQYECFESPWPVSNRDFVYALKVIERTDGLLMICKSIDAGVPERSGIVRGEIICCGLYFKRIGENVTELTYVVSVDPKGLIPKMISNAVGKKQCSNVNKIRAALG